jgi:lipoprotein-anchoring transpeptidase ErfK/SrfK
MRGPLAAMLLILLAGCVATQSEQITATTLVQPKMLVADSAEPFPVAPVNLSKIDRKYHRQIVPNPTGEQPGTVVVDVDNRFLYLVMEGGKALRYGIGVGREGFSWSGEGIIRRKAKWPTWTPPASMIRRQPELAKYARGQKGGPDNPLGARALYIYEGGRDTLYRIHGTSDVWSIGRAVSSGCIRMLHADVIDLYRRVPVGTRLVVWPSKDPTMVHDHDLPAV